jgi:hypothetical protein
MFGFTPKWTPTDTVESTNPAAGVLADTLENARRNAIKSMEQAAEIMESHYNQHRDDKPEYEIGEKVWLDGKNIKPFRPMKKLAEKRYGPFEITHFVPPSSYRLKIPLTWKGIHPVFNEVLLSPSLDPLRSQTVLRPPPQVQPDSTEHYEVEAILDSRKRRKKQFYLVKWLGYGHEDNTWEPLSNLRDAKEAINEFRRGKT